MPRPDPNETANSQQRSAVVFLIDGLNPLYLSPHGCTWIETPAMDALAASSVVFERTLAETVDPNDGLLSFLCGQHPLILRGGTEPDFGALRRCRQANVQTTFLSDSKESVSRLGIEFDRVISLPQASVDTATTSANDVSDTHLAQCFARILHELPLQSSPFLFVVHLTSLVHVWDAPLAMRSRHSDEEDPDPLTVTTPPNRSGEFDPDDILGVSHSYAAQVETLDTCLGVLMEESKLDGLFENTLFALAGQRGFPLGHSGQMGHDGDHLASDAIRVPLMIRFPDADVGAGIFFRTHHLTPVSECFRFVCDWMPGDADPGPPTAIQRLIDGDVESFRTFAISCSDKQRAIATPAWLLIRDDERIRLFVQPDDRWDVNSVQDRCRGIAEDLQQVLESACTQLAQNEPVQVETLADELVFGLE